MMDTFGRLIEVITVLVGWLTSVTVVASRLSADSLFFPGCRSFLSTSFIRVLRNFSSEEAHLAMLSESWSWIASQLFTKK